MNPSKSVLGVLGLCWVGFNDSTQVCRPFCAGSGALCWVCWVWHRAGACMTLIPPVSNAVKNSNAMTDKPNQPNTLNTHIYKSLNLKAVSCVGFVLGWVISVLGLFCGGKAQ